MSRITIFFAILVVFLFHHSSMAAKATTESAKKYANKWVNVFNENDTDKHLAFYDSSKDLQVIVSAGIQHNGIEELKKAYQESYGGFEFSDSEAKKMKTQVFGDTAIVTFEHRFKIRDRQFGNRLQIHIRTSLVLKHVAGDWKIIHEHSSPIENIDRFEEIR